MGLQDMRIFSNSLSRIERGYIYMQILVMGGTGAMGVPVVRYCSETADVFVTSRNPHDDLERVHYLVGNAHSDEFLRDSVFNRHYDVIIDFMSYSTAEFTNRVDMLLDATDHYIFLSSGRVYADKQEPLTEEDPRILDVCKDEEYLATDEYALFKARCEDILRQRPEKGWTIVRPYITFNSQRLQLGVYEKENWLRRFIDGHTIIVPEDILHKKTTITFGDDVALRIAKLSMAKETIGQTYNVSNSKSINWEEVLRIYDDCLAEITGHRMKLKYVPDSTGLQKVWNKYQIIYDRLYTRQFDNRKQEAFCGDSYTDLKKGIMSCLGECMKNPIYAEHKISGRYEGWADKLSGEYSPLKSIPGKKNKLKYLQRRLLST
ncbi:MAG: hypothetical protein IJ794_00525 [Lachnospiraceae bacterium]|nr:hypothetical protein [Lachnospiraceae bacterium]MBR1851649.1 hypothetical protein [Lachnospiraceae bacterium]